MFYKINVYKLENKISKSIFFSPKAKDERRKYEYLDSIIIEKNNKDDYEEIYTELKIDIFSKKNIEKNNLVNDKCINYRKLREEGIQIFAFKEDIINDNLASIEDINIYFKDFFDSNYKNTFDHMEEVKKEAKIKQKVRETKTEYLKLSRKK